MVLLVFLLLIVIGVYLVVCKLDLIDRVNWRYYKNVLDWVKRNNIFKVIFINEN